MITATLILFAACRAIDGDTLRCGQERVRLARMNAPELSEAGGRESADWLRMKIEGKSVTCVIYGRERYGRLLGDCFTGPGPSLSDQALRDRMAERFRGGIRVK